MRLLCISAGALTMSSELQAAIECRIIIVSPALSPSMTLELLREEMKQLLEASVKKKFG